MLLNTLRPRRNGQHFADNIFKRILFNENLWISIKIEIQRFSLNKIREILLTFVPNLQYSSLGSDNGLAPSRRQAIIWTNDGFFTDTNMIYASLGLNELRVQDSYGTHFVLASMYQLTSLQMYSTRCPRCNSEVFINIIGTNMKLVF